MTKKELLENKIFQRMPDDTELVFATAVKGTECKPVIEDCLTYMSEIVCWARKGKRVDNKELGNADPIYRHFLMFDFRW